MPPTVNGPGAVASAEAGQASLIGDRMSVRRQNCASAQQRLVERVHRLGARARFELGRRHPGIADDIDRRLAACAGRLDPAPLRTIGGGR